MLLFSLILALVIGSYVGKLITQYVFNNKVSPLAPIKTSTEYDIMKELEEEEEAAKK